MIWGSPFSLPTPSAFFTIYVHFYLEACQASSDEGASA